MNTAASSREPIGPHEVVDHAIRTRQSMRAFLPTPVPRATIEEILEIASRAPSGTNTQPWKVTVLTGAARQRLSDAVRAAYDDAEQRKQHTEEYAYYPIRWVEPYLARRRQLGWGLYGVLGIGREDKARMHEQHGRNYAFFDAPVGMIFTIDRAMEQGSWLDYGTFLENIMIAARARGLDTCPQQSFTQFHRIIEEQLALPASDMVVCGMALGYADMNKVENTLVTGREPVSGFARFIE
jgi:nitroreductase